MIHSIGTSLLDNERRVHLCININNSSLGEGGKGWSFGDSPRNNTYAEDLRRAERRRMEVRD